MPDDVYTIDEAAAEELATEHCGFCSDKKQGAIATFFLSQIYRPWGLVAYRGWARLVLDRRCLVEVPNALRHRAERAYAEADYDEETTLNFFYPSSHAPRPQFPSSPPLKSGGLPLWATVLSPESGPRGRAQPRPATPAPKPRLTSTPAFQKNIGTRKMTRERNTSCTQPSRQPNAGGATDTQTTMPPAACDRNALSAL